MNRASHTNISPNTNSLLQYLVQIARSVQIRRALAVTLAVASFLSVIFTYLAITNSSGQDFGPDPGKILILVLINLSLFLALLAVVLQRLIGAWIAIRRSDVGSNLQKRIIRTFIFVSVTPAILVSVASMMFFNYGIRTWFDERVSQAVEGSVQVAEGYLAEHKEIIRADILAMAHDVSRQAHFLSNNPLLLSRFIETQVALRSLTEAVIFRRDHSIVSQSSLSFSIMLDLLPVSIFEQANSGEVVVLEGEAEDRVRAVIKLDGFLDSYLLIGRFVDEQIVSHVHNTKGAVEEYQRLKSQLPKIQMTFMMIFIIATLILLLLTIWLGIYFATKIANSLGDLVMATRQLSHGNLEARIDLSKYYDKNTTNPEQDEIVTLANDFNLMAEQLRGQRAALISANHQLDQRRRFSDMVLSGVSAGVIGIDPNGRITHINRSAIKMLDLSANNIKGKYITEAIGDFSHLFEKIKQKGKGDLQQSISLKLDNNKEIELNIKIAAETINNDGEGNIAGFVITFDDVTELTKAQRKAAWSDVARRIAHEIKNPLTPISLAASRVKQKYQPVLEGNNKASQNEVDKFNRYVDTIIRHTDDIRRMVDSFAHFAKLPSPYFQRVDIIKIVRDSIFSQQTANSDISYNFMLYDDNGNEQIPPYEPVYISGDASLLGQAFGNIMKNSAEAIAELQAEGGRNQYIEDGYFGKILVSARIIKKHDADKKESYNLIEIKFLDNGTGFNDAMFSSLTEPYISTKKQGAGLGLAIVQKIIEDHDDGNIVLDKPEQESGFSAMIICKIRCEL